MNFLTKRRDSYFGIAGMYADLESHGSTQTGPAVLRGQILQESSRGKQPQCSVPAQEEMQCTPSKYSRIRSLITMLAPDKVAWIWWKKKWIVMITNGINRWPRDSMNRIPV